MFLIGYMCNVALCAMNASEGYMGEKWSSGGKFVHHDEVSPFLKSSFDNNWLRLNHYMDMGGGKASSKR